MANVLELARKTANLVTCPEKTFVAFAVAVSFAAMDYKPITKSGLVSLVLKLDIEKRHSNLTAKRVEKYLREFVKAGYLRYSQFRDMFAYAVRG